MLLNPQPWAEDGTLFINNAIHMGIDSIFHVYAGYLNLTARIITYIAFKGSEITGNGIMLTPLIMNIQAIIISVLCIVFMCSSHFDWLSSFRNRVVTALFILLLPGIEEVFGNATNINWWLGLFQFLVTLYFVKHNSFPTIFITILYILSSLSGPMIIISTFIIVALTLYNTIIHKKAMGKLNVVFILISVTTTAIQLLISLNMRAPAKDILPNIRNFFVMYPKTVFVGVYDRLMFVEYQHTVQFFQITTSTIIGFILLIVCVRICDRRLLIFSTLYIFLLMLLTFKGATFLFGLYKDDFIDVAQRYFFVPFAILIFMIFTSIKIKGEMRLINRIVTVLLLGLYLSNIIINFRLTPLIDYHWKNEVVNYDRYSSVQCQIPINPKGFGMAIPCKKS